MEVPVVWQVVKPKRAKIMKYLNFLIVEELGGILQNNAETKNSERELLSGSSQVFKNIRKLTWVLAAVFLISWKL
jgi:hypothetical protein